MRQTDVPSIETIVRLAELRGSLRKEVQIVASSARISEVDAASWMGVDGLYHQAGRNGLQHRPDQVPALRARNSAGLLVNGAEAALAGGAPRGVSHQQDDEGTDQSLQAHSHSKVKKHKRVWRNPDGSAMTAKQRSEENARRAQKRLENKAARGKTAKPAAKTNGVGHRFPAGKGYGVEDLKGFFTRHPDKAYKAKDILHLTTPTKRKSAAGNIPPALVGLAQKKFLVKVGPGLYQLKTATKKPKTSVAKKSRHKKPAAIVQQFHDAPQEAAVEAIVTQ